MYFPKEILEVKEVLRSLDHKSNNCDKINIIDSCIKRIEQMTPSFSYAAQMGRSWESIKSEMLDELKQVKSQCVNSLMRTNEIKTPLFIPEPNCCIQYDVKPYKNLCIFILSHPKNKATVTAEILSRINYLDQMTRDVTFIMPGYNRAQQNDDVVNGSDNNLQLTFDENLFIRMVKDLENKSNGKFLYNDACELVFIGVKSNGEYDFDDFQRLDLDILSQKRGIDPIKLILTVAQQFRIDNNDTIDVKKYVTRTLDELTMQGYNPVVKTFIAGAKKLKKERSLLREELSKVENAHDLDIRTLTFEDFPTSLTGKDKGRQADYNKFIENEANVVIFIFDSTAGEITEKEFDIAYNSLKENKRPEIFVYVRKRGLCSLRNIFGDRRLRNIKNKIFAYQKEYYTEYESYEDLRYLFRSAMDSHFMKKEK